MAYKRYFTKQIKKHCKDQVWVYAGRCCFSLANIAREQRSRPHWCGAIEAHRIRCLSQQQLAALLGMAWTIQLGFAQARVLHKSPPCIPGLVFYLSKIHRTLKGSQASIAETCCSSRFN